MTNLYLLPTGQFDEIIKLRTWNNKKNYVTFTYLHYIETRLLVLSPTLSEKHHLADAFVNHIKSHFHHQDGNRQ